MSPSGSVRVPGRRPRSAWRGLAALGVLVLGCARVPACPSPAGGPCNPTDFDCPKGYACSLAEVCTRRCSEARDCWVAVDDGCRPAAFPHQRLPDGGTFVEGETPDGYCPETKELLCIEGYCQHARCADGGCDYDLYGPSPFRGNRSQGPPS